MTARAGRLPDFVVIGAMKGGTTTLHAVLRTHPSVFMSREKELNYFTPEGIARGEAWYRRQFRTDRALAGEASPSYAMWPRYPSVPERMHAAIPEARLVYVVRDPVARAISHHKHLLARRARGVPVDEGVFRPWVLDTGRYATQLDKYLEAGWRMDRIHVLTSEDLRARRDESLAALFAFLGADAERFDASRIADRHVSAEKRMPTRAGRRLRRGLRPFLERLPTPARVRAERTILAPLSVPLPDVTPRDETRARLAEIYAPEAERLRALTGLRLGDWSV